MATLLAVTAILLLLAACAAAEPSHPHSKVEDWQGLEQTRKQVFGKAGDAGVQQLQVGEVQFKSRKMLGVQGLYVGEYKPQPTEMVVQQQGGNGTGIPQASVEQHKAEGCYLCYQGHR
jgi:hypothetical protein